MQTVAGPPSSGGQGRFHFFIIVTQGLAIEDEMAGLGIRELERRAK